MSWEDEYHLLDSNAAWVVWVNEDLDEGRGTLKVLAVCEQESTARRLARGANVQGADGVVMEVPVFKFAVPGRPFPSGPYWYAPHGPGQFIKPTAEDKKEEARLAEKRAKKVRGEAALQKARDLGMSDEDIAALQEAWEV